MSNQQRTLVCLDLDDTLVQTAFKFEVARLSCAQAILESLGCMAPRAAEIMSRQERVDLAALDQSGDYTVMRFARSWVETYRQLCWKSGLRFAPKETADQLYQLALQADRPPFALLPGALETVADLHRLGCELHIVTIGADRNNQLLKISLTGLGRFLPSERVHFAQRDKGEELDKLIDSLGNRRIVMVGNSIRHDIFPAFQRGLPAIHVPCPHGWEAESQLEEQPSGYLTLKKICDVPQALGWFPAAQGFGIDE